MACERLQRQFDRLPDEAEEAITGQESAAIRDRARSVLRLGPENSEALAYLAGDEREPDDSPSRLPRRHSQATRR